MAKPICVIYLPDNFVLSGIHNAPMELMSILNGNYGYDDTIKYPDYWKEYYWFCFHDSEIQAPRFEVFHEKDFTEIQFQDLQKLIIDEIEKLKSPLQTT